MTRKNSRIAKWSIKMKHQSRANMLEFIRKYIFMNSITNGWVEIRY
jgi:hypothetical protein